MSYENIRGVAFVGDLSMEDADVLAGLGRKSKSILEFGAGGSTQIFAQCMPETLVCVETDPRWISRTRANLIKTGARTEPIFRDYGTYGDFDYDLVFVDGVDHFRRDFAIAHWDFLNAGGVMVFHDTRRFLDFQNAMWVAQLFYKEISKIDVNYMDSNLTVIHKREPLEYVNWNYSEGKPLWAYGAVEPTEGEGLWKLED